jgi:hypothetical protein
VESAGVTRFQSEPEEMVIKQREVRRDGCLGYLSATRWKDTQVRCITTASNLTWATMYRVQT